jgi:hypothetical protein
MQVKMGASIVSPYLEILAGGRMGIMACKLVEESSSLSALRDINVLERPSPTTCSISSVSKQAAL